MRFRSLSAILLAVLTASAAFAQDPTGAASAQPGDQGGYRQRGNGRGFGGGMGMGFAGGRGVMGTVSEIAADHFVLKGEDGQTYIVHYSVNTRMMKMPAGARAFGGMRRGEGRGQADGQGAAQGGPGGFGGGAAPEPIKATDIKVGDAIGAMGEMDQSAKSIGAVAIVQLDPDAAKRLEEMRANYGKTWLQGRVTSIDGVKVTIVGPMDNSAHSFVADENTTFRKRRDPITLADIAVGDMVRADGAVKDGTFTASTVNVMGMPPSGGQRTPAVPPPPPPSN